MSDLRHSQLCWESRSHFAAYLAERDFRLRGNDGRGLRAHVTKASDKRGHDGATQAQNPNYKYRQTPNRSAAPQRATDPVNTRPQLIHFGHELLDREVEFRG